MTDRTEWEAAYQTIKACAVHVGDHGAGIDAAADTLRSTIESLTEQVESMFTAEDVMEGNSGLKAALLDVRNERDELLAKVESLTERVRDVEEANQQGREQMRLANAELATLTERADTPQGYCPDCGNAFISTAAAIQHLLKENSTLTERAEEAEREFDRLRQERYDALDARTTEGMSAAEWQLRTGTAERRAREAEAENATLRAERERDAAVVEAAKAFVPWMREDIGAKTATILKVSTYTRWIQLEAAVAALAVSPDTALSPVGETDCGTCIWNPMRGAMGGGDSR